MKRDITRERKTIKTGFPVEVYEGESIEDKCARIVENNEPISDGAPLVYTDRKDGVRPEYNIRTDKWEVAIETMDKVAQAKKNKIKENMNKGLSEPKTEPRTEPKTEE